MTTKRIEEICRQKTPVTAYYRIADNSTQAELRLEARWGITLPVDQINYPKNLSPEGWDTWLALESLAQRITRLARVYDNVTPLRVKINSRTISGPAKRAAAAAKFAATQEREFVAAYRRATTRRALEQIHKQIAALQTQQKQLLPELRRANSAVVLSRRSAADEDRRVIAEGQFWAASPAAVKKYFRPPFEKNYLADVSPHWRAALFLELEVDDSAGYNRLLPTDRGWLCGIDDNGDEWGLHVESPGIFNYRTTVSEAVALAFGIDAAVVDQCRRQGDLLFCPVDEIPENITLHPQAEPWRVRESHTVSAGIERNGRYFRSTKKITVSHTSHPPVTLPAGSYRLYTAQAPD